ncbi:MAG TPA: VOC family protein [Rubricoccaceae bacterium]|nr:VOC family protein [Rubricoccaceae bacterium]
MATTPRIIPCLWFADEAEEAARFYIGLFPNARINAVTRYTEAGFETHGRPAGSVMTVEFELDGQPFTALNGGPVFTFNEAVSLQVMCRTQEEIDHYWEKLSEGGDPNAQQCGWLKDRFGLSWQVVPEGMEEMLADATSPGAQRAMEAMLRMKKLDLAALRRAYDGAA